MSDFSLRRYPFTDSLADDIQDLIEVKNLWPLVYVLTHEEKGKAYIGETTNALARMSAHLANPAKRPLDSAHFITSAKFNKSATLDIESRLIQYLAADGKFELLNGNAGIAHHNYYQKEELYERIFKKVWDSLRAAGVASHSLEFITNTDLFKYSPYKSLSVEQRLGLREIMKSLLEPNKATVLVQGGAGTGKTILAIFLFKLILTPLEEFNFGEFDEHEDELRAQVIELRKKYPKPEMALVVPMSSFRKTLQRVFKSVSGLKPTMVIGPSDIPKRKYDILVVDEAHRLRRRKNLGSYFRNFDLNCEKLGLDKDKSDELEWVSLQSNTSILFYDPYQSIKPSDVVPDRYEELRKKPDTITTSLKSQFRVKGGNGYVDFIHQLLDGNTASFKAKYQDDNYEFVLFDNLSEMVEQIRQKNDEFGLSRLVAGYAWDWISKKDSRLFDIKEDGVELRWNSTNIDWVNKPGLEDEVGCIHTTQGYDLNYTGIIFGHEISYDWELDEIVVYKDKYRDKNGKMSIDDIADLKSFILNIYKTILLRGIRGTYVYACDPELRKYLSQYVQAYSASEPVLDESVELIPFVNAVPLYDLGAAAGAFSEGQVPAEEGWQLIPEGTHIDENYFACRVVGNSMNNVIPDGSICLFKKYTGGSRSGRIMLIQHHDIQDSDFGSGYTVKEYQSIKSSSAGELNKQVRLIPRSSDSAYTTMVFEQDQLVDLKTVAEFVRVV